MLDGSVSGQHAAPAAVYNYERNLAILLALALPVNTTNPMFAVLQNALSWSVLCTDPCPCR